MFFTEEAFRKYSFTPTFLQLMKDKDKEINGELPSAVLPENVTGSFSDNPSTKPTAVLDVDTQKQCVEKKSPQRKNSQYKIAIDKPVHNKKRNEPSQNEVPSVQNTWRRTNSEPAPFETSPRGIKSPTHHKLTSEKWKETLQKGKQKKKNKQEFGYIKYPIHKIPYPRLSWLTKDEQKLYLELHRKFSNQIIPSKGISKEALLFKELQATVDAEQKEYMIYLRDVSTICYKEYLFISPELDAYLNAVIENRIKRVMRYPQFYVQHDSVPLLVQPKNVVFFHIKTLLNLGAVPKICNHKNRMFANTKGFGSIERTRPPDYPEQAQKKVCSEDFIADDLALKHNVNIVISSSALGCLVDNHAPYHRQWELPIEVREYEEKQGDGSIQKKRVVFIDKPFVPRNMTVRQRSEWGHRFTVKHKLQNNKLQAIFLQQPDCNGNTAVLDLPKPRKENEEASDYGYLDSDYEEVAVKSDAPFDTVNIDDLETFGTGPVKKLNIFGSPKRGGSKAFKMCKSINGQDDQRQSQSVESNILELNQTVKQGNEKQFENPESCVEVDEAKESTNFGDQHTENDWHRNSKVTENETLKKENLNLSVKTENELGGVTFKDNTLHEKLSMDNADLKTSELTENLQNTEKLENRDEINKLSSDLVHKDAKTTVSSSECPDFQTSAQGRNVGEVDMEQMEAVSDEESDGLQIDSDINNSDAETKDLPQLDGPKDRKKSTRGRKKAPNIRTDPKNTDSIPKAATSRTRRSDELAEIDLTMIETDMKLGRRRSNRLSSGTSNRSRVGISRQSSGTVTALSSTAASSEPSDNEECELDCSLITQRLMSKLGSGDETQSVVAKKCKTGRTRSASLPPTTVVDIGSSTKQNIDALQKSSMDESTNKLTTVPEKRKRGRPSRAKSIILVPKEDDKTSFDEVEEADVQEKDVEETRRITRRSMQGSSQSVQAVNGTRTTRARLIKERTPATSQTSEDDEKLTICIQDHEIEDNSNADVKKELVIKEEDSNQTMDATQTSSDKNESLTVSTEDCPSGSKTVKLEKNLNERANAVSNTKKVKAQKKRGKGAKGINEKSKGKYEEKSSPETDDFVREEVDDGNYMFIDTEESEGSDQKISQFLDVNIENLEQDLDISESDSDISTHSPSKKNRGLHFSDEEDSEEEKRKKAKLAQQQWIASVRKSSNVHTKPSWLKQKSVVDVKPTGGEEIAEGEHKKPAVKVKAGLRKVIGDFDTIPASKPPRRTLPSVKVKPQKNKPQPTAPSKEIAETMSFASLLPSQKTHRGIHVQEPVPEYTNQRSQRSKNFSDEAKRGGRLQPAHIPVPRRLASVPSENQSAFIKSCKVTSPASPIENVIFSSAPQSPGEQSVKISGDTPLSPNPTEFVDNPLSPTSVDNADSVPLSHPNDSKVTLEPKVIPLERDPSQVSNDIAVDEIPMFQDTDDERSMYCAKSTLQIGKLPGITPLCNKRPADIPDEERDILAPPKRFSTFKRTEVLISKETGGNCEIATNKSSKNFSGDGYGGHKIVTHEQVTTLKSKRPKKPSSKEMNPSIGILDQLLPPETHKSLSIDSDNFGHTGGVKETVACSIDSILNKVLPYKQRLTKKETLSNLDKTTNYSTGIDHLSYQGDQAKEMSCRFDSKDLLKSPSEGHITSKDHPMSPNESQQSVTLKEGHMERQVEHELAKPGQHLYQAPPNIRDPKEWEMYENPGDFTAPKRHNVNYNLWQLGQHKVLIRCGLHCAKIPQKLGNKIEFIHLLPKLEYQSNHGYEQDTMSELSRAWISLAIRNNCKLHKLRIIAHNSEVINTEELTLDQVSQPKHTFSPQASLSALDGIFQKLYSLQPGHYLLGHSPGNTQAHIKKTSQSKVGGYNLHTAYNRLQTDTSSVPWVAVDTNKLSQIHLHYNRIPCTFEPKDSEEAKKFQQTNKSHFKGKKRNKKHKNQKKSNNNNKGQNN